MPVKISQLPVSTNPPNTADLLPIVQGGITKQTTLGALFSQLLGFLPSGIGAVASDLQTRGRQIVYLTDFAANGVSGAKVDPTGVLDSSAGIIAAINSIDTSGGKGGTVVAPAAGVFNIGTTTINGRSNVRLQFAGRRSTLINYSGTGSAFVFDGITESGLIGARISPGSSATAVALDIKTTSASVLENLFDDLEIASSNVAGQVGIKAVQSGGSIISENVFSRIYILNVDKPIVRTGCEGNTWHDIVVSTYGTGASPIGVNSSGCHNDYMEVRVAGVGGGVSTPIAYQETGDRNVTIISGDIGATGKTLNSSGTYNTFIVRRAVGTTPVGTYSSTDLVIDAQTFAVPTLLDLSSTNAGQVKYPAVQNASTNKNTLDDYHEDTWTPSDNSGAALAFTLGDCQYVKIGQLIVANFAITFPATVSGAAVNIAGLPYVGQNTSLSSFGVALSFTQYATPITGLLLTNTNTFGFYTFGGTAITNANLSGLIIRGTVTYRATA